MVMGEKIRRIGTFYVGGAYEISTWSLKPWGWNCIELSRERVLDSDSCSVVSESLQTHGLEPARLLSTWNSSGKNTGVGCHFLLQGIFPTQR